MKKQVAVIGLGRFGVSLASTLTSIGHEVLALDIDEKNVQEVAAQTTHAVQADATNEAALRQLGIGNFDIAIVTMSEIEQSVLSTILLKKLGVRYVIARAENELHGSILGKIGADKVVYPEREMGIGIAYVLTLGDVIDYIPVTAGYGVVKILASPYFIGKTLAELGFGPHGKWEVVVLLIQHKQDVVISPRSTEVINPADVLVVAGNWDRLEELFTEAQRSKAEE